MLGWRSLHLYVLTGGNKMEQKLNFCFKGKRTYLHSTDVFNKFLELFGESLENINFTFYKITDKNILLKDKEDTNLKLVFLFEFTQNGRRRRYYGYELENPINCRYPYDEDSIVEKAILENKCALLANKTEYSFIEHLVALTKFLHLKLFPKGGKWYFARLQLKEVPKDFIPLRVCLDQHLGKKLTASNIYVGNEAIGKIYFSLVE